MILNLTFSSSLTLTKFFLNNFIFIEIIIYLTQDVYRQYFKLESDNPDN